MTTLDLVDLAVQRRSLLVRLGGQGGRRQAVPEAWQRVGDLDGGIEQGLGRLVGWQGRVGCSSGRRGPGDTAVFEWSELTGVIDRGLARAAMELTVDQGGGPGRLGQRPLRQVRGPAGGGPGGQGARPVCVARAGHREVAWRILAERLEEPADRAGLGGTAGLAQLAELATDLPGMAREIASASPSRPIRQEVP
jgi:hypothetical protein